MATKEEIWAEFQLAVDDMTHPLTDPLRRAIARRKVRTLGAQLARLRREARGR